MYESWHSRWNPTACGALILASKRYSDVISMVDQSGWSSYGEKGESVNKTDDYPAVTG